MSIKERMGLFINDLGITPKAFEISAGLSNGFVAHIGDSIRKKSLDKIKAKYPQLNTDWLITEIGEMKIDINSKTLKQPNKPYNKTSVTSTSNSPEISEAKGAPYYDIDFKGGFDMVFNDQSIRPSFYIDFPPFNDADGWINATGKSMGPLIAHGDIVALKRVPDWKEFLLEGEIYALVTKNGFRTIKILGKGPDKLHYMLIPYNKSEEYSPQPIPKTMITHVFRVMGAMKKFF